MPPVGDDPVARRRRSPRAPELHRRPDGDRRPAAAAPPRRPERVAPPTDAAIAAAPNRIEQNGIGDGGQVAAPAGRAVDRAHAGAALVRASQWIKRRNAPPKPLVFQCRLLAMTPWLAGARAPELHRRPDGDRRPAAAAPPRRPERVAPPTDAAIAAAPNRIEQKWNRRRRPGGGPSGSRCRPRSCRRGPRARESMDKEEERAP